MLESDRDATGSDRREEVLGSYDIPEFQECFCYRGNIIQRNWWRGVDLNHAPRRSYEPDELLSPQANGLHPASSFFKNSLPVPDFSHFSRFIASLRLPYVSR